MTECIVLLANCVVDPPPGHSFGSVGAASFPRFLQTLKKYAGSEFFGTSPTFLTMKYLCGWDIETI